MAIYSSYSKLARVQLPPSAGQTQGPIYALIDTDGRGMITSNYSASSTYEKGDYVVYNDNLYTAKVDISTAEAWNSSHWEQVTVGSELKDIRKAIVGGIHFIGKTTTQLYDTSEENPITIGGASYTASTGDLTFVDLASVASTYATATAYPIHTYIKNAGIYYITNAAITASENTSFGAISNKLDALKSDPFFIFDGTKWRKMESAEGFGDLAFKDNASGTYVKPTGSGSVIVPTVSSSSSKLTTTTITGVGGTEKVSKMTPGTAKNVATTGTAVRYGTADVGEAVTVALAGTAIKYGTANVGSATVYGKANVGSEVDVGTALGGTTTFNTDAIKSASLTGTKTFNTDAIKSATLTGTKTFDIDGVKVSVESGSDLLVFAHASTGTVGISTTAASTGTVGISTSPATTGTVSLTTSKITPAVAAPGTQTLTPAVAAPNNQTLIPVGGTSDINPAVAAPNNQTIIPAVANGTITPWSETEKTVATMASASTTVATGQVSSSSSGASVVVSVDVGSTTANVNVGTTSDTVVVS